MFDSYQEADDYYDKRLDENLDEITELPAHELMLLHYDNGSAEWWLFEDRKIKEIIVKVQEKLKYMYQDLYHIEHGDYTETVKQEWEDDINDIQTKNPDWDEYEDSPDFYEVVEFLQSVDWKDFESNYIDEISCFNLDGNMLHSIKEASEEVADLPNKIIEVKKQAQRETIEECFS